MPDLYTTVTTWPGLVVGGNPGASRLYTYPTSQGHPGSNLTAKQATVIRRWIEIVPSGEGEDDGDVKETQLLTPVEGLNEVPLDDLGEGLNGAKLTFVGDQLTAGFLLTQLQMHAGAAGVHVMHPLFILWCDGEATPIDAFAGLDLEVEPNMSSAIGAGALSLSSFMAGCQYSVHFEVLEPTMGSGEGDGDGAGGLTGGCNAVTSFTANAQPRFANICANCHGGSNPTATNAMDLSQVRDLAAAAQANACAQVKGNLNLADLPASIIFQRVTPGQTTGHAFEFPTQADFNSFRDAVSAWAINEM